MKHEIRIIRSEMVVAANCSCSWTATAVAVNVLMVEVRSHVGHDMKIVGRVK